MDENVTTTVGYDDTYEALREGEVRPLTDIHNVEAALAIVRNAKEQVDDLKVLKKKRTAAIDSRVDQLEKQIEFLSEVIISTLNNAKEKTVRFPGVGKVSKRINKGKWIINDEDGILKVLKKEKEYDNIVSTSTKVDKKELNKLLDVWEKVDKIPGSVKREDDEERLTFSFEKEESKDVSADSVPVPVKRTLAVSSSF